MIPDCKYSWKKYNQFRKKGSENEIILKIKKLDGSSWPPHYVKSVQIRSFFWSEYKKIQTRKNSQDAGPENKKNYVYCKTKAMFLHIV